MKTYLSLVLTLSLTACAVCKSSDSPEVCRTKERDHTQRHSDFTAETLGKQRSLPST